MKLRLPKALMTALAAAVVAGSAYADYTWTGGSMTADSAAWSNGANWNGANITGTGPQTYNTTCSDPWTNLIFNGTGVEGGLHLRTPELEGWSTKMTLRNDAHVEVSTMRKIQGEGSAINVDGTSSLTLNLTGDGNDGHGLNVTLGGGTATETGGEVTLALGRAKGGGDVVVTFADMQAGAKTGVFTLKSTAAGTRRNMSSNLVLQGNLGFSANSEATTLHTVTLAQVSDINFTGGTGIDFSGITSDNFLLSGAALSASKRDAGQYYVYNDNGTVKLTYVTADFKTLTWNGGDLTWQTGSQMTGGTYANGDRVTFTADSNVTLGGAVSDSFVIINSGANVRLGRSNGSNQLDAKVRVDGTLTLLGAVLASNTRLQGSGALVIDSGSGDINLGSQFGSFAGTVDVNSGRLTLSAASPVTVRVHDGGQAYVNTNQNTNFEIEGSGWTASSDVAKAGALRIEGNRTLSGNITTTGDAGIQVHGSAYTDAYTATFTGTLSGSDTITKYGGGVLKFTDDTRLNHTGKLVIAAGRVQYGAADGNSNAINFSSIQINSGAEFYIKHGGTSMGDIILNGGLLFSFDQNNTGFTFTSLDVRANSNIKYEWNGGLEFATTTGSANLTFVVDASTEAHTTTMRNIMDYNGTIDFSANTAKDNHTFILSDIRQSTGNTLTLKGRFKAGAFSTAGEGGVVFANTGDSNATTLTATTVDIMGAGDVTISNLVTDSLVKSGSGSLSITNLTVNKELTMGYEGTFTVGNYTLADNAVLKYGQSTNCLALGSGAIATGNSVVLDVIDVLNQVMSADGFNLHISTTGVTADQLHTVGLSGVEFVDKGGTWYIKATGVDTIWDINWGGKGLTGSPSSMDKVASPGTNQSYYLDGTGKEYTAPAEGSPGNTPSIYGGSYTQTLNRNTWLKVTGGDYNLIAGGSNAERYGASDPTLTVNGNSHILMEGGSAQYVLGGNFKDGKDSVFNGDSYITISGDALVKGSIIGGSVASHAKRAPFTGDTHIFITSLQNSNDGVTVLDGQDQAAVSPTLIVGGSMQTKNVNGLILTGNTNIDINLSGVTVPADAGQARFVKDIIGGNAGVGGSGTVNHIGGDSNVNITGKAGITFTGLIIGGDWMSTGQTADMTGSTHVTITDGAYSNFVAGGSGTSAAANLSVHGSANLAINSGTFGNIVAGGNYLGGNATASIDGGSNLTLNGGTFNGHVAGGDYLGGNGTSTITAGSHITIDGTVSFGNSMHVFGGTYHNGGGTSSITGGSSVTLANGSVHNLVGGSFLSGNATASVDSSSVTVSGGSVDWSTVGGLYIGSGDAAVNASIGDIQVTISGGSVKDVIGGSFVERNSASSTVQQGNITVDLTGGSINGTVYAAGRQQAGTVMETASTTVNFGNGFTWVGGRRVTGDYLFTTSNGVAASGSTVTGNRTLNFTATSYTNNLSGVAFEKFDVVNVLADAVIAPTSFSTDRGLTKTGAGELVISGAEITGTVTSTSTTYNVQGGTLTASALGAGQSFSVASDTTAQIKNTGAAVSAASVKGAGTFVADTALVTVASNTGFTGTYTVKNGGSLTIGDTVAAGTINLVGTGSTFTGTGSVTNLYGDGGTLKDSRITINASNSKFDLRSGTTVLDGTTLDVTNHTLDFRGQNAAYSSDLKLLNRSSLTASNGGMWINEGASGKHRTTIYVDKTSAFVAGDFKIKGRSDLGADATGSIQNTSREEGIENLGKSYMSYSNAEIEYTGTATDAVLEAALADSDVTVSGGGTLSIGDKGIHALSATNGTAEATGRVQVGSAKASGSGILKISGSSSISIGESYSVGGSGATLKNVTLSAAGVSGATSGSEDEHNLQSLGEITSVDITAVAGMTLSNVTMYDSAITTGATVIYGTNVGAVASTATETPQTRSFGPGPAEAGMDGDNNATAKELTATTVQTGGKAKGSLTVDVSPTLLSADNAGGNLTWTIFSGVTLGEGDDGFSLLFGSTLKYLMDMGKNVSVEIQDVKTYTGAELVDNINNFHTGDGGLFHIGQSATIILTVENVPEPATGTLSVLALAALAVRRRRSRE